MLGLILLIQFRSEQDCDEMKPFHSVLYLYKTTILVLGWEWKELFSVRIRVSRIRNVYCLQ
jgi:hypothetical protein